MSGPNALARKAGESGGDSSASSRNSRISISIALVAPPGETDLTELLAPMYRLSDPAKDRDELLSALLPDHRRVRRFSAGGEHDIV